MLNEVRLPNASIKIVDFEVEPGKLLVEKERCHSLAFRIQPRRVKVRHLMECGREGSFGSVMFFPVDTVSEACANEPQLARLLIATFDDVWVEHLIGRRSQFRSFNIERGADFPNTNVYAAMRRIAYEIQNPGLASSALLENMLGSATIEVVREFDDAPPVDIGGCGRLTPRQMRTIQELIFGSHKRIFVSDIAKEVDLSVAHLRRLYKATTGSSLQAALYDYKWLRAKEMLTKSNLPLKIISHQAGFSHPTAFSNAFKRIAGHTPSEFRRLSS